MPISKRLAQSTAVDDQHSARDIAAGFARQQQRRAGQLARVAPPAQSRALGEALLLGVREQAARQIGQKRPRGEAIDRDV